MVMEGSLRGAHQVMSTGRVWEIPAIFSSGPREFPKGARLEPAGFTPAGPGPGPGFRPGRGWKRPSPFGLDLKSTTGGYDFGWVP
jgi:hypothetical protein